MFALLVYTPKLLLAKLLKEGRGESGYGAVGILLRETKPQTKKQQPTNTTCE